MAIPVVITAAVEGITDEVLLKRLCAFIGAPLGRIYGRYGKSYVLSRINGYNHSAKFRHWVVLLDLDEDGLCAPDVISKWLPAPARLMSLRVAVRELESWLLADAERMGKFLGVPNKEIPNNPDNIPDPKRLIVALAKRSRSRAIREDIVPNPGSGQAVGPAYTSRMIEFIQNVQSGWRPDVAAKNSDSLQRCISGISNLVRTPVNP